MNILLYGDSPTTTTAYANQIAMLAPALRDMGHKVVLFAHNLSGRALRYLDMPLLVGRDAPYAMPSGVDLLQPYADAHKIDLIITMRDPYSIEPDVMRDLRTAWSPIVPVDSEPLCEANKAALQFATQPIAVTQHGHTMLSNAGHASPVIPHMIDPAVFKPIDSKRQTALRKSKKIDAEFVAVFVGDNATNPSRKNIETALIAWSVFAQKHRDGLFLLHTDITTARGGLDIMRLVDLLDIPMHTIGITQPYDYLVGLPQSLVAELYQCADVCVNIGNEGFGMPTLESQSCGVPVICIDWAASHDLFRDGVLIGKQNLELMPSALYSFYARPRVAAVVQAFEAAYEAREQAALRRKQLSDLMKPFHKQAVIPMWGGFLEQVQDLLDGKVVNYDEEIFQTPK